jgi:FeS assembly SUF system regulator
MVRLSKLTDYGLMLLTYMAREHDISLWTARDLARESGLPKSTVSRLLQELLKGGLLVSERGIKGGYSLARAARNISVAEVIAALEGPIALTECSTGISGLCDLESCCAIKSNQQLISQAVRAVLLGITLADLTAPLRLLTIKDARGRLVPAIGVASGRVQ